MKLARVIAVWWVDVVAPIVTIAATIVIGIAAGCAPWWISLQVVVAVVVAVWELWAWRYRHTHRTSPHRMTMGRNALLVRYSSGRWAAVGINVAAIAAVGGALAAVIVNADSIGDSRTHQHNLSAIAGETLCKVLAPKPNAPRPVAGDLADQLRSQPVSSVPPTPCVPTRVGVIDSSTGSVVVSIMRGDQPVVVTATLLEEHSGWRVTDLAVVQ